MRKKYILAIDQGTSSSRVFLFDHNFSVVASAQQEFPIYYPQPSWVEQDAEEIWASVEDCLKKCLQQADVKAEEIASIGITNQRETTVIWDKKTGKPIYRALVWQSRQTEGICEKLRDKGLEQQVRDTTGLVIDAYFSATKIRWILDETQSQLRAEAGELCFGTIDCWLLWKLTGGQVHATDYSNASRTMIYDIHNLHWDDELCAELSIPLCLLPEVKDSSGEFGRTNLEVFGDCKVPIGGIAGDQQAALFGQACFDSGEVKNTYGTGCFMLMNTGTKAVSSENGLLTTIAWSLNGSVTYALEGSVFIAGAAVQWLRDSLKVIDQAEDSESLALELNSNEGVYLVPAFNGLGTPYWQSEVRGACFGLTRGSDERHFSRAVLEAIAYQSRDLLEAMKRDAGVQLKSLRVDGGACNNKFLMQFQSDLLGLDLCVPESLESSVLGAATLAGLSSGFWSEPDLIERCKEKQHYQPTLSLEKMNELYAKWKRAVEACQMFSK